KKCRESFLLRKISKTTTLSIKSDENPNNSSQESMVVFRFSYLLNKLSPFSLQKFSNFSSSSLKVNPRSSNFYSNCEEGSLVYQHKLQFQRPDTIEVDYWKYWLKNSVSFIGLVVSPLKPMTSIHGSGFHTWLEVKNSRDSNKSFRILLMMWRKMAEISSKHLKEDDYIYVAGRLGSYTKVDENGHSKIFHKVNVDELNYVARNARSQNDYKPEKTEPTEGTVSTSSAPYLAKKVDHLYLWQVFFVSPHEWWDNRKNKKNPRSPDFKHKDTGETLWLSPTDPPWVRRQLQLHDSRMEEQGYRDFGKGRSRVSTWKYDE
ncbi:hypothetical protein AQUCO_01000295v1, partial [Aquilegia coerulea]